LNTRPTKEAHDDGLPDRLRVVRMESGLGQLELAEKLGVSRRTVAAWERGEHSPPASALEDLVREFGVDLNWLVLGRKSGHPHELDSSRFWKDAIVTVATYMTGKKLKLSAPRIANVVEATVAHIRAGGKPTDEFLEALVETARR
jgi:transcriptional regulator with XRE-family HTH domain